MNKNHHRILLRTLPFILGMATFSNCTHAENEATGPFEYNEIHLPEKYSDMAKEFNLNNVDNDWGLWGHHLQRVLPEKPEKEVFALVGNSRSDEQFCFSSEQLFDYICQFVNDNYGTNHTQRFAILPNDNTEVCLCDGCTALGNTKDNASPAVCHMLRRLAEAFPRHLFFTSYYLTTKDVPTTPMPANTGVLVSTMTFPIATIETAEEQAFEALLKAWKEKVGHVYVWDYINNFDDYFTPYPVFTAMQRRLQLYQRSGVTGIFLNGSGSDYSTLSRLKTYVLGHLLRNPSQDWKTLVSEACSKYYPVTGKTIASFVMAQEAWATEQARPLPLYEGTRQALTTYLPKSGFTAFFQQLQELLPKTRKNERKEVERMWQAMSLTQLEIHRLSGMLDNTEPLLENLKKLQEQGITVYSESCWFVNSYIKEYQEMVDHARLTRKKDILVDAEVTALSPLDEEYTDLGILTDGLQGLPSNYHCGQMLSSAAPVLKLAIPATEGMRKLRVSLTANVLFHIALPTQVTLTDGDRLLGQAVPAPLNGNPNRSVVEFNLPAQTEGTFVLSFFLNPKAHAMAIDEIEGYPLTDNDFELRIAENDNDE